ncbi:MAG: acetyltransferase [bacterium]|nr:acetyltransferase [bacterium]
MKKVVGVGAGGHAKVLIDILKKEDTYEIVGITDVKQELFGSEIFGIPIIGSDEELPRLFESGVGYAFIGVGSVRDPSLRTYLFRKTLQIGFRMINIVHKSAIISDEVVLGCGISIMAGAIINIGVKIGDNVIINTGAIIEHDCVIEDNVHISPGVKIGGGVRIGKDTHIGIGATIIQNKTIGEDVVVGAGSVVIRNVPDRVTVVGSPAKILKKG